jgi:hypothetical protein
VNNAQLNAREIEALTFIYIAPVASAAGERGRWSKLLKRAWMSVRKRIRRPPAFSNAADWIFPGL